MTTKSRSMMQTGLRAILAEATQTEAETAPSALEQTFPDAAQLDERLRPVDELESFAIDTAPEPPPQKAKRPSEPRGNSAQFSIPRRVGTLEQPYLRQRDNQATRKVGVVLPVAVAERLQIHCVKSRQRTNTFIEAAIVSALDALQSRRGSTS